MRLIKFDPFKFINNILNIVDRQERQTNNTSNKCPELGILFSLLQFWSFCEYVAHHQHKLFIAKKLFYRKKSKCNWNTGITIPNSWAKFGQLALNVPSPLAFKDPSNCWRRKSVVNKMTRFPKDITGCSEVDSSEEHTC